MNLGEPLDRRIEYEPNTGCWLWSGCDNGQGYGALTFRQEHYMAHRLAYQRAKGEIPDALCVCHRCDTPACCNPEHLFLGTRGENNHDTKRKGRVPHGERRAFAKLKDRDIPAIRADPRSLAKVAADYGVSVKTIQKVVNRVRWKHVQ